MQGEGPETASRSRNGLELCATALLPGGDPAEIARVGFEKGETLAHTMLALEAVEDLSVVQQPVIDSPPPPSPRTLVRRNPDLDGGGPLTGLLSGHAPSGVLRDGTALRRLFEGVHIGPE